MTRTTTKRKTRSTQKRRNESAELQERKRNHERIQLANQVASKVYNTVEPVISDLESLIKECLPKSMSYFQQTEVRHSGKLISALGDVSIIISAGKITVFSSDRSKSITGALPAHESIGTLCNRLGGILTAMQQEAPTPRPMQTITVP